MLAREVSSTHKSCDIIVCSSHTKILMAYNCCQQQMESLNSGSRSTCFYKVLRQHVHGLSFIERLVHKIKNIEAILHRFTVLAS